MVSLNIENIAMSCACCGILRFALILSGSRTPTTSARAEEAAEARYLKGLPYDVDGARIFSPAGGRSRSRVRAAPAGVPPSPIASLEDEDKQSRRDGLAASPPNQLSFHHPCPIGKKAVREKHGNGGSGSAKTGPSIDPVSPAVISRQRCPPEKRLGARSISLVQGNVEAVCRIYISFATNLTCSVVRLVLDHKLADVVALSTKKELPRRVQQWLVEEHQIEQAVAETFPFEEIKIFIQNELKHRRLASGISTSNKSPVKRQKACLVDHPSLMMDDHGIAVNADVGIVDRCVGLLLQQGLPQEWFCFLEVLRSEIALQCPMFDNVRNALHQGRLAASRRQLDPAASSTAMTLPSNGKGRWYCHRKF